MSLKPLKETVKLLEAIENSKSLEESLRTGNMSGFLMLEDSTEAIEALNKNVNAASADIKTLGAAIPGTMPNTQKALKAAMDELIALRLKPDPTISLMGLRDPVAQAGKVVSNAAQLASTIVNAANTLVGVLNDLEIKDQKSPIKDVLENMRKADPEASIPDENAFLKGVEKAWQPPKGAGGFFKDIAAKFGFGGGSDFFGLQAKTFAQDILSTSFEDVTKLISSGAAKDAADVKDDPAGQMDDQLAKAGMTPDVMAGKGKEGEGEGKEGEGKEGAEGASETKKWSELSANYLKTVKDQGAGKKYLDALKGDKAFTDAVKDLINLEESMYRMSLGSLLFEELSFDVLKGAASKVAQDDDAQTQLAVGLAKVMADQGVKVANVPEIEEPKEGEGPAGEKEAAEEQANADAELKSAVKDEAGDNQSPAAAAMGAVDSWVAGLSPTSQKSLQAKNRVDGLKQAIGGSLDRVGKVVEKEVGKAIAGWRKEHEETLMKSKRFAKKNFDMLQQLIPQLAASMVKKANEASVPLSRATVHKSVYAFLDRKFFTDYDNVLAEGLLTSNRGQQSETDYDEDDMIKYRWLRMAGLGK